MKAARDALAALAAGDDRLLTTGDAARLIHVERDTIVRWCNTGKLASFTTPGGHRRIWLSDMRKTLDAANDRTV